jgi:hypothetical protein
LTAFGELKIVASADIGELGEKESEPAVYNWKWRYSAPGLAIWAVLVVAIVLVKPNRNAQALLVLVPLLVVNVAWSFLRRVIGFPSSSVAALDGIIISLTVGLAVLWLLSHWLGNRNRFLVALLALVIIGLGGIAGAVSYPSPESSQQTVASLLVAGLSALILVLGFALAGWWCRKRYRPVSFMLWLAVWTVAATLVIMLGYVGVAFVITSFAGHTPSEWISVLFQVLVVGAIFGGCLYAIVLPFMILAIWSRFFRQRFYACLRLKSMSVETKAEPNPPLPEV